MNVAISYPAVNGEIITQAHADYCKTNGHASYTVDGKVTNLCPRCGDTVLINATFLPNLALIAEGMNFRRTAERYNGSLDWNSQNLTDAPKTPKQRRECLVGVWQFKNIREDDKYSITDVSAMIRELRDMQRAGRTERWRNAVMGAEKALINTMNESDPEFDVSYVIRQFGIYMMWEA